MKRKRFRAAAAVFLMLVLIGSRCTLVSQGAGGEGKDTQGLKLKEKYTGFEGREVEWEYGLADEVPSYKEYKDLHGGAPLADIGVEIPLNQVKSAEGAVRVQTFEGKDSILWEDDLGYLEFQAEVEKSGMYQLEMDYYLTEGSSNSAKRALYIDGAYAFTECSDIVFDRFFKDKGEPVLNSLGDETRPSQEEIPGWRTTRLLDTSGMYAEPFHFYLEAGKHTIRLGYVRMDMHVAGIRLTVPENIRPYEEIVKEYQANGYQPAAGQAVTVEAELHAYEKNDPTLRRESDGDPLVSPASTTSRLLNVMGAYRWRSGNQSITWEIEAPEDGLYKIAMYQKQSWNDGLPSYRQIAIDGKVPFAEMLEYRFDYTDKWKLSELSDQEGRPYEFYLEKGVHSLTMTVKFGDMGQVITSIDEDIQILSDILLDITLIAGSDPDPNYDYGFFNKIPDLQSDMEYLIDSMQKKYDLVKGLSDKVPAMANNFLTIKSQLEAMVKNPYSIARKIGDLTNSQESLSTWYLSLQSSPLVIDYFKIGNPQEKWESKSSNVFQRLSVTGQLFLTSFTKDYDNVGSVLGSEVEITDTIQVWIARGTEWAEVIKEMADEEFTPQTGIAINVNVLPASQLSAGNVNALMLSITSGKAPDVALGVDVTSPVEFAIRDAVYDLSAMEGFLEVQDRFVEATLTPYKYNGGVFAIPETMDFNVMFYRKDILNKYGIQLPETRQQLYDYVMPALYQNGMEFYYGRDFTQFLFQNGGSFYTEDGLASALDTPEAFRAFKEYTEMFTNYGVPEVANFYQRMRSGTMPLGIGNFNTYMQLSVAAPEIAGKWGIAPLPGVVKEDGSIDRTAGAITAQGDVIMKQSTKPLESWEFLKWWSSTPVQTRFAREVEALMGAEARWNTANKEAFLSLSWSEEDVEVIKEQWEWAEETPIVLGGYFTSRHLTNAWTSVVISGQDVREALEQAVKDINRELRMKQEEYGVIRNDDEE